MKEHAFLQCARRAAALGVVLIAACSKSGGKAAPAEPEVAIPAAAPGVQQTKVIVDDKGFTPSHVEVQKGKPASLVFVRTTDDTCAKEVVFPDLKLEKELPLRTAVNIDIPTGDARTLTFQCGMAMYKSAVVIQ
ncbi:MAG TPA: cupredoxin domain-containing protein [Polyangiaceae bacterium]|nr:cupredoxin domain-containing protein [Polyangiaceae bacterium]